MEKLVGREAEQQRLKDAMHSSSAELIAIYGRRRIGKTFLISQTFKNELVFQFVGTHNGSMKEQLQNFSYALKAAMGSQIDLAIPQNWATAFDNLKNFLAPIVDKRRAVIFFDEFPWIHTQKSNFLKAFDHFWNSWASKNPNLTVVICGSAASWMIQNVVNARGGLHNRVTQHLRLMPFTLHETEAYLKSRSVKLDRYQILQLYMTVGGVPYYLNQVKPKDSATQAIDNMFYVDGAPLRNEYTNLYRALFDNASHHEAIVKALSKVSKGLTRNELITAVNISSGGTVTKVLTELEESGFISSYVPMDNDMKDAIYKLTDEYSLFYLKFIDRNRAKGAGTWVGMSAGSSWISWSGYAFESICFKHIRQIKQALGPIGHATESVWRYVPAKGVKEKGAQIDLLIDRSDRTINVCEMKFSNEKFTINKTYAGELKNKIDVFQDKTKTKKNIHLTMITTYGAAENDYYKQLIQSQITMKDLFEA